jgi:hypothetical protein
MGWWGSAQNTTGYTCIARSGFEAPSRDRRGRGSVAGVWLEPAQSGCVAVEEGCGVVGVESVEVIPSS